MTSVIARVTGRSLVSDDLFERLVRQVVQNGHVDREQAVRIMDQALVFLKASADNTTAVLRPSKEVDLGWHTFILNTVEYADFCQRVAGRFLHHVPDEFEPPSGHPRQVLAPTVNLLRLTGFAVDDELWAQNAECSQCHGGCTDCGQGGPKR